MWKLDCEESWALKSWCFWSVVLEKTPESPLYCKEIQPVHPEGDQSWVFIGRTDAEAETTVLWPPGVESWLIGKDPDAGKDWGQEEKGTTEDEMVEWPRWLNGHGFGWAPGVGDGQGGLAWPLVHGVTKSWTGLSDWTELRRIRFCLLPKVRRVWKNTKDNAREPCYQGADADSEAPGPQDSTVMIIPPPHEQALVHILGKGRRVDSRTGGLQSGRQPKLTHLCLCLRLLASVHSQYYKN